MKINEKPTHWDIRFFSMAQLVGSWSEDRSRKVGAVLVGQANEIRSIGFNGFPRGVAGNVEQRFSAENSEKYYWFEHAERNAIFNAARVGISTENCILYSTLFPCSDCLRALIQCGVAELNTFSPPEGDEYFQRSFEVSLEMASESGLQIKLFDENLMSSKVSNL